MLMTQEELDATYGGIEEAVKVMDKSKEQVSRLCRQGRLKGVLRFGSVWMIPRESMMNYCRQRPGRFVTDIGDTEVPDTPLSKIRENAGFALPEAAAAVRVAFGTFYDYESGVASIPKEIAERLAAVYEVDVEDILIAARQTEASA